MRQSERRGRGRGVPPVLRRPRLRRICWCRPSRAWTVRCSSSTRTGGSATSTRPGRRPSTARSSELTGRVVWAEFPEAVGGPFETLYRAVRDTGRSGGTEAFFAPLGKWFRAEAFLSDAGLVVTYDDVTERRRGDDERVAALAAREEAAAAAAAAAAEAERAGRHLMLLGEINLAHVLDRVLHRRHRRGGRPVRPPGRSAAGRLVPGERGRRRRAPARRRAGTPRSGHGRGDAPLRRCAGRLQPRQRPRAHGPAQRPAGGHPRVHRRPPRPHGLRRRSPRRPGAAAAGRRRRVPAGRPR